MPSYHVKPTESDKIKQLRQKNAALENWTLLLQVTESYITLIKLFQPNVSQLSSNFSPSFVGG